MAVKIPPMLIIALVVVVLMILTMFGFFSSVLFNGPEIKAVDDIADALNGACMENQGYVTTINIFLPDSKQGLSHREYFYVAVNDNKLLLKSKLESLDVVTSFMDYITQRPGEQTIKEIPLKACKDKKVQICRDSNSCNSFQFESNLGYESLTFTLNRTVAHEVLLTYTRATVCGDGVCTTGKEDDTSCPEDCKV